MIGAICIRLNEKCRAKLYPVCTYSQIDWNTECSTELGDEFVGYNFIDKSGQQPVISIAQSLNGEYILRLTETKRYVV